MSLKKILGSITLVLILISIVACEDETSTIGSVISRGEVEITIDTLDFNLYGKARRIESFDSKTGNLMIGNIQVENYGNLNCSFVTRLMCSANLAVDDSLFYANRVDSCKLIMGAQRREIVGDSLAPQALTVYKLDRQLPSDISNTFDPSGYFNPSAPFATKSYTISEIAKSDSAFYKNSYVELTVDLPKAFGEEIFEAYKTKPEMFQWPQTMAKEFLPGLYVKPTFGNGCVANITTVYVGVFYHSLEDRKVISDKDTVVKQTPVTHLAVPFTVSPEVLSSNNISYSPAQNIIDKNMKDDGQFVITTPGGYIGEFLFPAETLIERYKEKNVHLSTVNDLILYLPAEEFDPDSGIGVAQNVLMVKSSEYESFFQENKIPDSLTAFTGVYDAANKRYYFNSLRNYFLDLLTKDSISEEDVSFVLVPVEIETETVNSYYGEGTTYVTKCVPYASKPTMTLLKTDQAIITFSFSTQIID
ncbi:MAG: DUF4270 family protein [Muribaculaceae bacterium]|nr:DUF4270 family protein [Muribaculaceae bacterium]